MSKSSFHVKFTAAAYDDSEQIYSYISKKLLAETAADNLLEKIESSIMRLKKFPYSGSLVSDEPLRKRGYRKLIIDNYIVIYLVNEMDKQTVIMRILYGAQNYQNIL
ncbi:MAG TPA: type II toxin-antitoxin system RelE/ParE family toxin [Bacillota bacterium]|nr:type II toxin-antitoxin system RelE/ParE family toxin [Bacillota bacterium]HQI16389.1 type II toxin-antitoxin system RelE/ParE family toxin [Bacillota bacterium]